jgi:hypothetical protein
MWLWMNLSTGVGFGFFSPRLFVGMLNDYSNFDFVRIFHVSKKFDEQILTKIILAKIILPKIILT